MAEETTQINTRPSADVKLGFGSRDSMEALQRAALVLASSSLVPTIYRNLQ